MNANWMLSIPSESTMTCMHSAQQMHYHSHLECTFTSYSDIILVLYFSCNKTRNYLCVAAGDDGCILVMLWKFDWNHCNNPLFEKVYDVFGFIVTILMDLFGPIWNVTVEHIIICAMKMKMNVCEARHGAWFTSKRIPHTPCTLWWN